MLDKKDTFKNTPLGKIREKEPEKYDANRTFEAMHDLLVAHQADFALICLRNDADLLFRGWSNSPEGLLISQIVQKWLDEHLEEINAQILEAIQPKTPGMEDSLEAEFSTEEHQS